MTEESALLKAKKLYNSLSTEMRDYEKDIALICLALTEAFDEGQRQAVRLPKEHDIVGSDHPEKYGHAYGWNDCRKEVKKLNGVPDGESVK